jgi:hypothetical protein
MHLGFLLNARLCHFPLSRDLIAGSRNYYIFSYLIFLRPREGGTKAASALRARQDDPKDERSE